MRHVERVARDMKRLFVALLAFSVLAIIVMAVI